MAAVTESEVLDELRHHFSGPNPETLRSWAKRHGCSHVHLHYVLTGKTKLSARFAEKLGYRREVAFHPIKDA